MPLVLADRVRDTTTTTGTGTVTLSGTAPTGYQTFATGVGNANTTYYTINASSEWEVGIGTFTTSGNTLSRTTVLSSSNAGSLVNFAVGTKDVFVTYPAGRSVNYNETNNLAVTGRTTFTAPNSSSTAWTTTGVSIVQSAATFTDTSSTGTVSEIRMNNFAAQTLAATNVVTATTLIGTNFVAPVAGTNITATNLFALGTDSLRVTGTVLFSNTGSSINLGTSQSSGAFTIGGASQTGALTLGRSTVSQTTSIQAGATASGSTKTINFGTGGLAGSTTNIAIGSTTGTSTTTLNGVTNATSIANALGAVGTPSYTFTGDLNTGMWSPAADTIAFSEGGVEVMRITSAGNVGIGNTAPSGTYKLEVTGASYASSMVLGAALPIASGGTNATATPTAGGAAYGTGTAYAFTTAGTAGQVLVSTGATAPAFGGIDGGTF